MKSKKFLNSVSKSLSTRGFRYVELDTVIPLDYINRKTSDNFRNSMFTFANKSNEFALRSDLSVMSLLKYVESGSKKKEKWWYQGEVFRRNENNESPVYNQLGFEILGSTNQKKDDEEQQETTTPTKSPSPSSNSNNQLRFLLQQVSSLRRSESSFEETPQSQWDENWSDVVVSFYDDLRMKLESKIDSLNQQRSDLEERISSLQETDSQRRKEMEEQSV